MISRAGQLASFSRVLAAVALGGILITGAIAIAGGTLASPSAGGLGPAPTGGAAACAATVMNTLGDIDARVYHEGLRSERTVVAARTIRRSAALTRALEDRAPAALLAAVNALVASGRMTDLTVSSGGRILARAGASDALTPRPGTIRGPSGAPLARYELSVWSDQGFIAESNGLTQSETVIRSGARTVLGALDLPGRALPSEGSITRSGVSYRYSSFPARAYPTGSVRVYLFRAMSTISGLCGASRQDTLVNTLRQIAGLIYIGETGPRALHEIKRVQGDAEMLSAVAARDAHATKLAIDKVLNQHIVRLRVLGPRGELLSDVGGPFVLGPRTAPLARGGHTIGSFVLSIQDDSGYLKLTDRLAGLKVLMYMGPRLVMGSIDPVPSHVPEQGLIDDAGHNYRVFTEHLRSFPGGPLRVVVFVPIPYS